MQLLVIEPERYSAQVIQFMSKRRGHRVLVLPSVADVPDHLPFDPSVAIVALSGLEPPDLRPVEQLRDRFQELPLMVTVEATTGPIAAAVAAGASHVMRKPYHPSDLVACAEMLPTRRGSARELSDTVRLGDLSVDLGRYTATKGGVALRLTKLELRLLYCLARHHRQVSPTETLLSFGWETPEPPNDSLLKTHIAHLRKKLAAAGGAPVLISARHSLGYVLDVSDS